MSFISISLTSIYKEWLTEKKSQSFSAKQRSAMIDEIADAQFYLLHLLRLATSLNVKKLSAVKQKMVKKNPKHPADKVWGSVKKLTHTINQTPRLIPLFDSLNRCYTSIVK